MITCGRIFTFIAVVVSLPLGMVVVVDFNWVAHASSLDAPVYNLDTHPDLGWLYWVAGVAVAVCAVVSVIIIYLIKFSRRLQNEIGVRRLAEAALRQSEERLSLVIDKAADMIFFHDMLGRFMMVNQSVCDCLGYTKIDMGNMSVEDIDVQFRKQNNLPQFWESLKEGVSKTIDTKLRTKNGEILSVEINLTVFKYQNERLVLADARDVGHRWQAEANRRYSHKMEALGTLSGGIAHDFNNILGIILGSAELAMDDVPPSNPARGCLDEIKTATKRARDIVRQILTFTRKVAEEKKTIHLATAIQESIKLMRATIPTTIAIEVVIASDDIVVMANEAMISQVMVNLCANAADAMHAGGGIISVELIKVAADESLINAHPELSVGNYACLTVSDTGSGIPAKILDRIFDPYFTTKQGSQGSGMGLAVVHGNVKIMRGHLFAQSVEGEGTKMVLLLPLAEAAITSPQKETIRIPRGNELIMFVDDESAMVRYCKRLLERLGYEVVGFTDPIEALEQFRAQPANFDLVITDMTMPGMTGDKLAREMMNIRAEIPVVLCTGYSELLDEQQALEMGIKAFHMKPFDRMELAHTIRIVLDGANRCEENIDELMPAHR